MGSGVSGGVTPSHLLVRYQFSRHSPSFSQRVDVSPSFDSSGGQREVTCRITANLNEFNTVDRLCTDAANVINPNASVPLGIAFTFILSVGELSPPSVALNVIRPLFPV